MTTLTLDQQINPLIKTWADLLKELKRQIADDYRASDDPADDTPGICVTIGFTPADADSAASWSYQTGDNSYSGGAYGHPYWGVVYLYRRSNCRELAKECADELRKQCGSNP